jgi:hypothetical protein
VRLCVTDDGTRSESRRTGVFACPCIPIPIGMFMSIDNYSALLGTTLMYFSHVFMYIIVYVRTHGGGNHDNAHVCAH